jgi:hypothetical protein
MHEVNHKVDNGSIAAYPHILWYRAPAAGAGSKKCDFVARLKPMGFPHGPYNAALQNFFAIWKDIDSLLIWFCGFSFDCARSAYQTDVTICHGRFSAI